MLGRLEAWMEKLLFARVADARQVPATAGIAEVWSDCPSDSIIVPIFLGDVMPGYALMVLAEHGATFPDHDIIYGDDDEIDGVGRFVNPKLKPDWSPIFQSASGYIGDAVFVRRAYVARLTDSSAAWF